MKDSKFVTRSVRMAALALLALTINMAIVGCTSSQIADSFAVAESALVSTSAILAPVNPGLAAVLKLGGVAVHDAYQVYTAYDSAPAADKATVAGRVRVAVLAAQQNLATLLADARIKNPELVVYVTAYVAVANTVLTLIVNHLPKQPSALRSASPAPALPTVPNAKSPEDLKKYFNSQVTAGGHPEAVIQ